MITILEAMNLTRNNRITIIIDGKTKVYRVNGKIKLWKRDNTRFKLPIKHGLYTFDYLTDENNHLFTVTN